MPSKLCVLCHSLAGHWLTQQVARKPRRYLKCPECHLIFAHPDDRLPFDEEKARYECHQNSLQDPGYRTFLMQLVQPLQKHLVPGAEGLDYGAGPGPLLAQLLNEKGFPTRYYDPIFFDERRLLKATYDFVTCTETVEHFFNPYREFQTLTGLLKPGGWLAVMTSFVPNDFPFTSWYYAKDPTHVTFYQRSTFAWIGQHFGLKIRFPSNRLCFFNT